MTNLITLFLIVTTMVVDYTQTKTSTHPDNSWLQGVQVDLSLSHKIFKWQNGDF